MIQSQETPASSEDDGMKNISLISKLKFDCDTFKIILHGMTPVEDSKKSNYFFELKVYCC